MTTTAKTIAAVYARYSSDLQNDRSVEDQFAVCRQIAQRNNLTIDSRFVFSDRAKSAASMFDRDGLLELMTSAKTRGFQAVIVESLDRLSRDQEDLAGIVKRFKFHEIKLITSEGEATDMHVGIRGIIGSMFLKDLGDKVRRGHNGRVREGKIPGAVTYGYRMVAGAPGEREIHPEQAVIVKRIFVEYASGKSTRLMAEHLTRDGIPTPKGGAHWNHQAFVSGRAGRRGIIGNQLYVGKLTWNANRNVLNPDTGRKIKRPSKAEDVIIIDVPHLRIIDQSLFDRANGVCSGRAMHRFGPTCKNPLRAIPTVKHSLLSGLLTCSLCGSRMRIAQQSRDGSPRVACAAAHQHSTCAHRKTYDLSVLETTVLSGVKSRLTDPRALVEYTKAYHARWNERQKEIRIDLDGARRSLSKVTVQIDRLVTAITDSDDPMAILLERLKKLEAERAGLVEKVRLIEAEDGGANVVSLHPAAIDKFAAGISSIHEALTSGSEPGKLAPFQVAFRNVFERIVVHPTGKRMPYEVTPFARLSAIMGIELFPEGRSTSAMLAEQGIACSDLGHTEKSVLPESLHGGTIIPLGKWRQAA